jgi:peptidoglycan/xylan/chitin deacetylase (PgdA/CDA1 family)
MPSVNPIRSSPIPNFRGPDGQTYTVAIGWHVDGEAGAIGADARAADHLAALSEAAYGVTTALPRILDLHQSLGIPGTFFVPGYVAELHPDRIRDIVRDGHEVAHHGYLHENCFFLSDAEQREVFRKGSDAIAQVTGQAPTGWSAPSWGVKASTLEILRETGLTYDCSLMEYDQPYLLSTSAGEIVELPISMVLDDWQIFGAAPFPGGGVNATAALAMQIWQEEFDGMLRFGGFFNTSFHPNLTGRLGRLHLLYRLLEYMRSQPNVWWATCAAIAQQAQTFTDDSNNLSQSEVAPHAIARVS